MIKSRPVRWFVLCLVGLLAGLSAVACTDGPDDGGPASETLVYVVPGLGDNLDPAVWQGDPGRWLMYGQVSSLFVYDAKDLEENGCAALATAQDLRAELAESWEFNSEGNYYDVTLREARSPAGNTLTADDVVWSYERLLNLSIISPVILKDFAAYKAVEKVDDRTVRIHVDFPTAIDLAVQTIHPFTFGIFDSATVRENSSAGDPWGTEYLANTTADFGPWQVERFEPGSEVVYIPNPNYWGPRGNIGRWIIRAVPEASTRLQLLRTGDADIATRLTFDQYRELESDSEVVVKDCQSPNRDSLMVQNEDERFSDPRVRQALSYAIDRNRLIAGPYRGYGKPSVMSLPQFYGTPRSELAIEYDPGRARELLAEAGYPNGFSATMTYSPSRPGPHAEVVAIELQSQLAEVGIDVKLELIASAVDFNTRFQDSAFEMMLYLDPPAVADPLYTLKNYNLSTSPQNRHNYHNPEYDALTDRIAATLPGPELDELLVEADRLILEDMPIVYLVDRSYLYAYRSSLDGFEFAPHGEILAHQLSKTS